ncbi:Epimerase domain-containing protein [Paraburkholderia sabiae]|uniref:NAD-dependent epimerase/dehydratase family protein n=1 Tax=Paraburkholderia sabiae TaxID=273251 RepID=UPI001CB1870C|nr:NAD-dependent epimerase/dehydratase family protein [Paraburkholderia sabiae]CAG9213014.1 Epimerase domain-containing protein [Paraburkholderia sabiae]
MISSNIADIHARRVLVLGGTGFLGTHLVDALVRSGSAVRVFERLAPPAATGASLSQRDVLVTTRDWHGVEMVRGDFVSGDGLAAALEDVDLVYHLVSTMVPSTSNLDPIADVQSNLVGSVRLLQLMQAAGVKRIVYVSSGGTVYGNPTVLPVPETHALNPLCSYGVVKVAVENYLHMYSELHGIVANVLRVSNPYGTHSQHIGVQGVIPTFFRKIADGTPLEIWGDGSVVRDYIHVSDVVTALLRAGAREQSATFNIGSGTGHSVNEILDVVQQQVGRKASVRYQPQRSFDVERIFLDITKAREELNWQPSLTLAAGCARYWEALSATQWAGHFGSDK